MQIINNRIIHIGKSNTNQKELSFKSLLLFDNNNFIIFPFGTTRIRYQTENIFDITLIKLSTLDNYFNYKLIINKTEKALTGRNAKLFYKKGWELDLKLWHPYKSKMNNISLDHLYTLIPPNYGSIEFNNVIKQKYKIGIVIPFYSRYNYVKAFLDSLKKTDLNECLIVFIDESMTKEVDDDKLKTHELIKNYSINTSLIKIYKNKHGNMFDSILTGMDLLSSYCEFLTTLDSDTLQKEDWISKLLNTYLKIKKDFKNKHVLCSGFNVVSERHSIIKEYTDYIIKNSVGGCNMFFSRDTYFDIVRKTLISHKWDSNIINYLQTQNSIIGTTNPSVIQHIGKVSSGHRIDINSSPNYDKSDDF